MTDSHPKDAPQTIEQARQALEICPSCGGEGCGIETHYVTRDMALDACEPSMEGQPIEERRQCADCGGAGYIPDDRVDALIAAVRSEAPAPGWQPIPIELVPPEVGKRLLLYWTTRGWSSGSFAVDEERNECGWKGDEDLAIPRDQHHCTHAMFLPPPPGAHA